MTAYHLIIAGSLALIVSYLFSEISKRTNIPSVLLLIGAGVVIGQFYHIDSESLAQPLEVLGIVGLIMIVLEGALDLELTKEKLPLIKKASGMAFFGLVASVLVIGLLLSLVFDMQFGIAVLYATPLSVISSAIVIPSVESLEHNKKEFLIYESCISDIIGIMMFYFVIDLVKNDDKLAELGDFGLRLGITIVISVITSFGLIFLFKFIKTKVKIFLFLAILMGLYALEKSLHLSPLILILIFGLMLKNNQLVFRGALANRISRMELKLMEHNFHIITRETAFVLRTFFFIVFGMSMVLSSLADVKALGISLAITAVLFGLRWLFLKYYGRSLGKPLLSIAPRGLITVLLFYSIPSSLVTPAFPESVVLYVVLFSSLIMAYGLISNKKKPAETSLPISPDESPSNEQVG
ncbi:MAG: cation:proton antiporter [Bacteroidia bacterium]|nr:cation:proton antiporter [Bacteroidia bacterium]